MIRTVVVLVSTYCDRTSSRRSIYRGLVTAAEDLGRLDTLLTAVGIDPIFDATLDEARKANLREVAQSCSPGQTHSCSHSSSSLS